MAVQLMLRPSATTGNLSARQAASYIFDTDTTPLNRPMAITGGTRQFETLHGLTGRAVAYPRG